MTAARSSGELTYGLERLAMYVLGVDHVMDMPFNDPDAPIPLTLWRHLPPDRSRNTRRHNFDQADTEMLFQHFQGCRGRMRPHPGFGAADPTRPGKPIVMAHPAYDQCIKASHLFNLLDARGVISVTERQAYIGRVRALAKTMRRCLRRRPKPGAAPCGRGGCVNGKIVAGAIVLSGLVAGIAMYWLQVYAFYEPVAFTPGAEIRLTPIIGDQPEAIVADNVTGIDAELLAAAVPRLFHHAADPGHADRDLPDLRRRRPR